MLCCDDIQFSKSFMISEVPPDRRAVWFPAPNGMEISTTVKHSSQHITENEELFVVFCDASLENLVRLYADPECMGWKISCSDDFPSRRDVIKAMKSVQRRDEDLRQRMRQDSLA